MLNTSFPKASFPLSFTSPSLSTLLSADSRGNILTVQISPGLCLSAVSPTALSWVCQLGSLLSFYTKTGAAFIWSAVAKISFTSLAIYVHVPSLINLIKLQCKDCVDDSITKWVPGVSQASDNTAQTRGQLAALPGMLLLFPLPTNQPTNLMSRSMRGREQNFMLWCIVSVTDITAAVWNAVSSDIGIEAVGGSHPLHVCTWASSIHPSSHALRLTQKDILHMMLRLQ